MPISREIDKFGNTFLYDTNFVIVEIFSCDFVVEMPDSNAYHTELGHAWGANNFYKSTDW